MYNAYKDPPANAASNNSKRASLAAVTFARNNGRRRTALISGVNPKHALRSSSPEKTVDYTKVFAESIGELEFPPGFKYKSVQEARKLLGCGEEEEEEQASPTHHHGYNTTEDEVQARLKGLPGNLQLDYETAHKYFGEDARGKFFERYKWLSRQRNIIALNPEEKLDRLVFENEKFNHITEHPFGPLRPGMYSNDNDLDHDTVDNASKVSANTSTSSFRQRFKDSDSHCEENDRRRLIESKRRSGFDHIESDNVLDEIDEDKMIEEIEEANGYGIGALDGGRSGYSFSPNSSYAESFKSEVAFGRSRAAFVTQPGGVTTNLVDQLKNRPRTGSRRDKNPIVKAPRGALIAHASPNMSQTITSVSGTSLKPMRPQSAGPLGSASLFGTSTALNSASHVKGSSTLSNNKENSLTKKSLDSKDKKPPKAKSVMADTLKEIRGKNRPSTAKEGKGKTKDSGNGDKDGRSRSRSPDRKGSGGSGNKGKDVFSDMLLDEMMKGKAPALQQRSGVMTAGQSYTTGSHLENGSVVGDDHTVYTASTVSTLGLLLAASGRFPHLASSNALLQINSETGALSPEDAVAFIEKLKLTNSSSAQALLEEISRGQIQSPRTKYLTGCMQENLNPRASVVVRRRMTKQLNLQHHGLGDKYAVLLSEIIRSLPYIQSINIADNILTDDGMGPIILAAKDMPHLLELNLSMNIIGPVSAKALFDYLMSPTCPLERLILNSADVDDFECSRFVEAIRENRSLRELDLSNNKLGTAENLNTVMPDIITGGEALAELLRDSTCRLTKLKLDWNMIRLDGAIDLAKSIAINKTLVYLDLSFNSLSTEGGMVLGVSILRNTTLQTLILENNQIDVLACFTICAGIIENRGLKRVVLDGNPIGEQGAKALMLIPLLAGNRVRVSAARCNINIRDSRCWFDFDKLIRDFRLNMESGFERAIAIILLHLIAGHHSYVFTKFEHEIPPPSNIKINPVNPPKPKFKNFDLVQITSKERANYLDEKQRLVLDALQKVQAAAGNIQLALRLFQETDIDGSGELDKNELGNLMFRMGIRMNEKRLEDLMNKFDVDSGGKIEVNEFLMLLKSQQQDAANRIKELLEQPVYAIKGENKQFLPPENGFLNITVIDGFARKAMYRILSACDREYIEEVAEEIGGSNTMTMISSALQGVKLRLEEGLAISDTMLAENNDKVAAIKKLIMKMNDSEDARNLIFAILDGDRTAMLRLKRDLGLALKAILGNANGYYLLDLSKEMDRLCVEKLLEISMTRAYKRMERSKLGYGREGDLSQKGNFSSFRNESYNKTPFTMTPAFASPIPFHGKLEFDFSCTERPPRQAVPLSDSRFIKILTMHHIINKDDVAVAIMRLKELKESTDKTLKCNGVTHIEFTMDRAIKIGEHCEAFYGNLSTRIKQFQDSVDKEGRTECDSSGNLISCFERDNRYPMPESIGDFYVRKEMLEKEREAKLQAEKRAAALKAARLADKHFLANLPGIRREPPRRPPNGGFLPTVATGPKASEEPDSEDEIIYSPTDSEDEDYRPPKGKDGKNSGNRKKSTLAPGGVAPSEDVENFHHHHDKLKDVHASDGEEDEESEGDAEESEPELDPEDIAEADWQKEFALFKAAYGNKEAPKLKLADMKRRKNIKQDLDYLNLIKEDDFIDKFKAALDSPMIQIGAKARRIIDMVEDIFARAWIFSRHLALLVESFSKYGYYRQTKFFGTYRVDLVISLFARVLDVHNFEVVLEVLSPFEHACLNCRLGWLNIYNPCKPEGGWELDMSRREERLIAKTLCVLATHEPGDNWTYETFRWMRTMESMPGWELTQPWLTEDGMPMRGLLNITYYSGEGQGKNGCKPYIGFRKSLLNLVLINEEEIVEDSVRSKLHHKQLPGERAFQKHYALWDTYLAPPNIDSNRKR